MFWNKIKERAPEIILLGAAFFLQFFRLGIGEIQSWDEALYILRANACIRFGAWIDQTQYAIGGLYSSTHPPLIVWMIAFVRMIFGASVFAARIVSALSAVIVLIFFYKLAKRFFQRWTVLFATASLACAQHFLWFGHHAQLDIPMFAFIVASVYYAIRTFEEERTIFAIIAGILYGCALMSKVVQGLYLIPFILALPYIFQTGKRYSNLTTVLAIAFIVALPWHICMLVQHPNAYREYSGLIGSLKQGTYAVEVTTKWWYYINQTIVNFPVLILGLFVIPNTVKKWKAREAAANRLFIIIGIWFIGFLVFLTSFQTRMQHFSLFLLLPTSLLLCFFIEEYLKLPIRQSTIFISAVVLLSALIWSSSELLRNSIKDFSIAAMQFDLSAMIITSLLTVILFTVLYKYFRYSVQNMVLFSASLLLLAFGYYRWGSRHNETFVDGAEEVGNILLHSSQIYSLTAYHDDFPHESYLPQLNYYTNAWLIGWDKTRTGAVKTWNELDSLITIDAVPRSDAAVIYVSWDTFYKPTQEEVDLLYRINQGLSTMYGKALHSKKYQLYWDPK